jgi:hypothetical protein
VVPGFLNVEASRSHSDTRWDSSSDETSTSNHITLKKYTEIQHASGGIRTLNPSKRATAILDRAATAIGFHL